MKRLTTALLLLGTLTGCSYASQQQALDACNEWRDKGKVVEFREEKNDFRKEQDFKENNVLDYVATRDERSDYLRRMKAYVNAPQYYEGTRKEYARSCLIEEDTRQVLGKENESILNGEYDFNKDIRGTYKVVENFRY